jgi:hypothetical protein
LPRVPSLRLPLFLLLLTALVLAGCGSDEPSGERAASGEMTGKTAEPAAAFVDSVGVNTHTYYSDTVYYSRFATIEQRLRELGVHHVRENLVPDRPDQYQRLNALAAAGVRSTLILGDPDNGTPGLERLLAIVRDELPGSVDAIEGPNEFDLRGGEDWEPRVAAYQAQLYAAVEDDPELAALPVLGPSAGGIGDERQFTDLSGDLDYGNIHPYPDGEPPETNVGEWLAAATRTSADKPVMATESGYHDALAATEGQRPVSEAAMATYVPRLFLDYFRRGIPRSFQYELVDEFPDAGETEPESDFGLLRNDLTPKPAFTALRNLIAVLDDPGGDFDPGRLDYTVSGDRSGLQQLLLQKSDGSFYLVLWRAKSVWDADARRPLDPGSRPLELRFATPPRRLRLYEPAAAASPRRELTTASGPTSLEVGPEATVVEIQPG